jgi:hypothetical protein
MVIAANSMLCSFKKSALKYTAEKLYGFIKIITIINIGLKNSTHGSRKL